MNRLQVQPASSTREDSIRSERQLVDRLDHDLLFRWFVGLGIEDPVWDATTFTKNRDRLLNRSHLTAPPAAS